ncbi:hypothetical protein WDW89_19830 [Deltaproteobacteria bacterium TL4]
MTFLRLLILCLMGMVISCNSYQPESSDQAVIRFQFRPPASQIRSIFANDLPDDIETIIIHIIPIISEGTGLGVEGLLHNIYPKETNVTEELLYFLDPGEVKIRVYAYNKVVFKATAYSVALNLEYLQYFATTETISLKKGEYTQVDIQMQPFQQTAMKNIQLSKIKEGVYQLGFDLSISMNDAFIEFHYGLAKNERFQVSKNLLPAALHQELTLELPYVPPHLYEFILSSSESQIAVSNVLYCDLSVCGKPPLRLKQFPDTALTNGADFSEGFSITIASNQLEETVKASFYFSLRDIGYQGVTTIFDSIQNANPSLLLPKRIFPYVPENRIQPKEFLTLKITPEIWGSLNTGVALGELKSIDYYVRLTSESGDSTFQTVCKDSPVHTNPLFPYAALNAYCGSRPYIIEMEKTESEILISWGVFPNFVLTKNQAPESYIVDIEVFDNQGNLVLTLNNQTSSLQPPNALMVYRTSLNYAKNFLSTDKEYHIGIRLNNQPSENFSTNTDVFPKSGGKTPETAVPLDLYRDSLGGFMGIHQGEEEYFSFDLKTENAFSLMALGVTNAGDSVYLTVQLIAPDGNVVLGFSQFGIAETFIIPMDGTYILKIFKANSETVPLSYRLVTVLEQ